MVQSLGCAYDDISSPVGDQACDMVVRKREFIFRVMVEDLYKLILSIIAEQAVLGTYPKITAVGKNGRHIMEILQSRPGRYRHGLKGIIGRPSEALDAFESSGPYIFILRCHIAQRPNPGLNTDDIRDFAIFIKENAHESISLKQNEMILPVGQDIDHWTGKNVGKRPEIIRERNRTFGYMDTHKTRIGHGPNIPSGIFCDTVYEIIVDPGPGIVGMGAEVYEAVAVEAVEAIGSGGPEITGGIQIST